MPLCDEEINKILCEKTKAYALDVWENQQAQFNLCMSMSEGSNDFAKASLSGACMAACIIREKTIHAVNLGDVRAILITQDQDDYFMCTRLTFDHSSNEPAERTRLEKFGLNCQHDGYTWRVNGMQPSRVVGDYYWHHKQTQTFLSNPMLLQSRSVKQPMTCLTPYKKLGS